MGAIGAEKTYALSYFLHHFILAPFKPGSTFLSVAVVKFNYEELGFNFMLLSFCFWLRR